MTSLPPSVSRKKPMRIGILGSGFMGTTHARAYAKIPGVSIAAVSSRNRDRAEKLAREVGARATLDERSIFDDPSIEAISNTLKSIRTVAAPGSEIVLDYFDSAVFLPGNQSPAIRDLFARAAVQQPIKGSSPWLR